jgi:hypothetical protein
MSFGRRYTSRSNPVELQADIRKSREERRKYLHFLIERGLRAQLVPRVWSPAN